MLNTIPLHIDTLAKALTLAGLELGETADIFRRNPLPDAYDDLVRAMRVAKQTIALAEKQWGVTI